MMQATGHRRAAVLIGLVVCLAAPHAFAQDIEATDILIAADAVWANANMMYPADAYDNLQSAIREATRISRQQSRRVTIWVVPNAGNAPWEPVAPDVSFSIPADARITLLGIERDMPSETAMPNIARPSVRSTGGAAFDINTDPPITGDVFGYRGGSANRVILDGLEIYGSKAGVLVRDDGGAATGELQPTINGCWIKKSVYDGSVVSPDDAPLDDPVLTGHGVCVLGDKSEPLIVNCSITDNAGDGVYVATTGSDASVLTDVLHCSIIGNADHGVYVASTIANTANAALRARVRNSIVYLNGDASGSDNGGIVWADGVSIVPDTADINGNDASTGAPVTATILGAELSSSAEVYFGPPSLDYNPPVIFTDMGGAVTEGIQGLVPPAYNSAPGTVDVHIVRSDGHAYVLRQAFTYTENTNTGTAPIVTNVEPAHGPNEGGNWVKVEGARFEPNCEVWFDTNQGGGSTGVIDSLAFDKRSPNLTWLSSSLLYVEVPDSNGYNSGPIHVLVHNRDSNMDSPGGGMFEYQYDFPPAGARPPEIVQVVPDFVRRRNDSPSETIDIMGWDFEDGCQVRIGGIPCAYGTVDSTIGSIPDLGGVVNREWRRIADVEVPFAAFGSGGSYDVEVTNPNGLHDILKSGLTYYPDGTPLLNDEQPVSGAFDLFNWSPANFVAYDMNNPATITRSLYGDGFDAGIAINFDDVAGFNSDTLLVDDPLRGLGDGWAMPDEAVEQHVRHTQRFVEFALPNAPDRIVAPLPAVAEEFPQGHFGLAARDLDIAVSNVRNAYDEDTSAAGQKTVATQMHWLASADYFEITGTRLYCEGGDSWIEFDVTGGAGLEDWLDGGVVDRAVYVDNQPVPDASITVNASSSPILVRFDPASVSSEGFFGVKDLTLVWLGGSTGRPNPAGEDLYFTLRDAVDIPPPAGWGITARSVEPRVVPATGGPTVYITGSGFHGPAPVPPASAEWTYTEAVLIYNGGANEMVIRQHAPAYGVFSFNEIAFESFDVTANTDPIPTGVPVDLELRTMEYDPCAGAPTVVATDRLQQAITFIDMPQITKAYVYQPSAPADDSIHWGPVTGGGHLEIEGTNDGYLVIEGTDFDTSIEPFVRIGDTEAALIASTYNSSYMEVRIPPAPLGLPGTYDVSAVWNNTWNAVAVAPEDQRYTYIMDGKPRITSITPNEVAVDTSENPDQDPAFTVTIMGTNFDDHVYVTFTYNNSSDPAITEQVECFGVSPTEIVVAPPDFLTILDPSIATSIDTVNNEDGTITIPDGLPDPGSYTVSVTVRNHVDGTVNTNTTSDAAALYYLIDQVGGMAPLTPELLFNDVYANYSDYVNVGPGTGSISVDPLLEPNGGSAGTEPWLWWLGKLQECEPGFAGPDSSGLNPMRDKAARYITRSPYTDADFEFEPRPDGDDDLDHVQGTGVRKPELPDIGADEIQEGFDTGDYRWFFCSVSPDPVGAVGRNAVRVDIGLYPGDSTPDGAFILPQGVGVDRDGIGSDELDLEDAHQILLVSPDSADGTGSFTRLRRNRFFCRNHEAVELVMDDIDGSNTPTDGDVLADGHAAVYLWFDDDADDEPTIAGDTFLGADSSDLTDGGIITDDAILGRHFLIDTQAPWVHLTVGGAAPAGPPLGSINETDPRGLVWWENLAGPYASQGITVPDANHPYGALPATWRPRTVTVPNSGAEAPYDRSLWDEPIADNRASAFFNTSSFSNLYDLNYGEEPLLISVGGRDNGGATEYGIVFVDWPPYDEVGGTLIENSSYDTNLDRYTGLYTREVAGFEASDTGVGWRSTYGPAHWGFAGNTEIPVGTDLTYDYETMGTNLGFDREERYDPLPDEVADYGNSECYAMWQFSEEDTGTAGIPYSVVNRSPMHIAASFYGRDLAGNTTPTDNRLDPLHLWWMIEAWTELTPVLEGLTLDTLPFKWNLDRGQQDDPEAVDADAQPLFTWRLWSSPDYTGISAPYTPLPAAGLGLDGWSTWTPGGMALPAVEDLCDALDAADREGHWLLLVVIGADEAGNVELWPDTELNLDGSGNVTLDDPERKTGGKNWQRFRLQCMPAPDTTVAPVFWYNDIGTLGSLAEPPDDDLGMRTMIPLAEAGFRIEGEFYCEVDIPAALETEAAAGSIKVHWELLRDGDIVADSNAGAGESPPAVLQGYAVSGDSRVVQLPYHAEGWATHSLDYMPENENEVFYVFRAKAFVDANGNNIWDNAEVADPTPANVSFKVLRRDVAGHMDRLRLKGKQPVKIREMED